MLLNCIIEYLNLQYDSHSSLSAIAHLSVRDKAIKRVDNVEKVGPTMLAEIWSFMSALKTKIFISFARGKYR